MFIAPLCIVALLVALFAPQNVHLSEGQTMSGFVALVFMLMFLWPALFALMFGATTWIAMSLKGTVSPTTLEVICDDRDQPPDGLIHASPSASAGPLKISMKRGSLIWAACGALVMAVIIFACYVVMSPRAVPPKVHDWVESPDGRFVAAIASMEFTNHGTRSIVQSVSVTRKEALGNDYATNSRLRRTDLGNTVASIHSCENEDIHVTWADGKSLVVRYSQTRPDWADLVSSADGVIVTLEDEQPPPTKQAEATHGKAAGPHG